MSISNTKSIWTVLFGTTFDNESNDLAIGNDGSLYITGTTRGDLDGQSNSGLDDAFVSKFNNDGEIQWTRLIGSSADETGYSISIGSDGSIYIAGVTDGDLDGQTKLSYYSDDVFVSKFNSDGDKQWTKLVGVSGSYSGKEVGIDISSDDSIYITGNTLRDLDGEFNNGSYDTFISKFNSDGDKQWSKLLGSSLWEFGEDLSIASDGSIYITGKTDGDLDGQTNSGGLYDAFVSKFSSEGVKQWTKLLGTSGTDEGLAITNSNDGFIYLLYEKEYDSFLARFDSYGEIQWEKSLHESVSGNALTTSIDGSIYVTGKGGYLYSWMEELDGQVNAGGDDIYLSKFTSNGDKQWISLLGTSETDVGNSISIGDDDSIYVTGYTEGDLNGQSNSGGNDAFLIKLAETSSPTGISLSSSIFDENIDSSAVVATLLSIDEDLSDSHTYSLVSGLGDIDNDVFTIEGNELIINSSPDYESQSSYQVRIKTTDEYGLSYEESITLNVNDLYENIDDGDASFSIFGEANFNEYLSIKRDSQDPDGTGNLTYQWKTSIDGNSWTNAGDNSTYKIDLSDSNKFIKAEISYIDNEGHSELIQTSEIQIPKHTLTSSEFSEKGFREIFGTDGHDSLSGSGKSFLWGLNGDDELTSKGSEPQYLIGGSGNDTYIIKPNTLSLVYEAPNKGTDSIYVEDSYAYGYVGTLDNKHLIAIEDDTGSTGIFAMNATSGDGVDQIYFDGAAYSANYFLSLIKTWPGYIGNISWEEVKPYVGDIFVEEAKNFIEKIITIENQIENTINNSFSSLSEVSPQVHSIGQEYFLPAIRDYDGNLHANAGNVSDTTKSVYKYQGLIDVNADGTRQAIYTNKESGRWVTASINSSTGEIDYSDHGEGGTTRIVGIYEDPLIAEGSNNGGFLSDGVTPAPANFGVSDEERYIQVNGETIDRLALNSQVRFQNDLKIDNLSVKTAGDYDSDGVSEVYWKTNDGTAYLRALMHDDGNIRYANYQSEEQMSEYLTANGNESIIIEIT